MDPRDIAAHEQPDLPNLILAAVLHFYSPANFLNAAVSLCCHDAIANLFTVVT